jgi:beta-lactamase superfamily II metal-dependent hydrolase
MRPHTMIRLLVFLIFAWSLAAQQLEIHYINVGWGGAVFLKGPDGTTVLMEAGDTGKGTSRVVPYLQQTGIFPAQGLDYTIASHQHCDHIGGLPEVIAAGYNVRVKNYYNGSTNSNNCVTAWNTAAATTTAGSPTIAPVGGQIALGDGAKLTFIARNGSIIGGGTVSVSDENDRSIAVLVQYGGFDYLWAGDLGGGSSDGACTGRSTSQKDVETAVIQAISPGGAFPMISAGGIDLLHVNHHGSESSTNHTYMNLARPEVAVIGVGAGQSSSFQLPRVAVVEHVLLAQATACVTAPPARVLQTEEGAPTGPETSFAGYAVGNIKIATDGVRTYTVTADGQVTQGPNEVGLAALPLTLPLDDVSGPSLLGSLGQIASAGTWKMILNFLNLRSTPLDTTMNFFDNGGNPLSLPFTFPQSPATGTVVASTLNRTLAPNAQLLLESTGPDDQPALIGWSQLLGTAGVNGYGIFANPALKWEAVVPLEARDSSRYTLAFDNTSGLAAGLAIANLVNQPSTVPVVIRDSNGIQIGTATIGLPALGHTSFMLNTAYPVTAGNRGTIEFQTPALGRISVLGLRANGVSLTTLPVLADVTATGGSITHTLFNGGFTNSFTLVNTGPSPASYTLNFFDENGTALQVPLQLLQTAEMVTTASLTRNLSGYGTVTIQTIGQSGLSVVAGSAQLTTTGTVSGFGIFNWIQFGQEASVPLETRTANSYVLAFDNTNGLSTGLALANVAATPATVSVVIRDDAGNVLQNPSLNLVGQGHTAFMLPDTYSVTVGKRGTVVFVTPVGGRISAIGLRATPAGNLTTIPVMAK